MLAGMATSIHHVNTSDAAFMQEMIAMLRGGVQDADGADTMASRLDSDPELTALAHASSVAAAGQIAAMVACLDNWNAEPLAGTRPRARIEAPVDAPRTATSGVAPGTDVDARLARHLRAYHHAVIELARQEMVEGLNDDSRDFARSAISEHSGALRLLAAWQAGRSVGPATRSGAQPAHT